MSFSRLPSLLSIPMPIYKEFKRRNDFDSRIIPPFASDDPRYFGFVILLRVALNQINPPKGRDRFEVPDSMDIPRACFRWNDASWAHFKQEFLRVALATWDGAFLLRQPSSYAGLVWPDRGDRRYDALCGLFIKLVDESEAHAILNVPRMVDPHASFASDSTLLDSNDVDGTLHGDLKAGLQWKQHAAAHEVGHLLGLHHVANSSSACRSSFANCYGSNVAERINIMGTGDMLSFDDAKPWRERIEWHTGADSDQWEVDWASDEAALRGSESLADIPKKASGARR